MILRRGKTENCTPHGCRVHQANPLWYKIPVKDLKQLHFIYLTASYGQCRVLGWDLWEPTGWIQLLHSPASLLVLVLPGLPWSHGTSNFVVRNTPATAHFRTGLVLTPCSDLQHRHPHLTKCQGSLSSQWRLTYRSWCILLSYFSFGWVILP